MISYAGLIAYRELDDALGLSALVGDMRAGARTEAHEALAMQRRVKERRGYCAR